MLDFDRYSELENDENGIVPIEIDLEEFGFEPLMCLSAGLGSREPDAYIYEPYVLVLPGEFVAKLYEEFGPRLLEQNVRTFLQVKIKV